MAALGFQIEHWGAVQRMNDGRPEQEHQREAPATVQVTESRTGTVRVGQKAGRAGAEKLFLMYNNMLNDCYNRVYGKGCMSDRGGEGDWMACDAMIETTQQNRMGRQEGLFGVVRASRHWAGVTCGASFREAAANHEFR